MASPPPPSFAARVAQAPRLGVGISCEYESGERGPGVDAPAVREAWPELVHFLEVGTDVRRGLDEHVRRWVATGAPTTYHFLDVNLAEAEDPDPEWLHGTLALADAVGAAWLCGDAGYWHFGPRERGHDILLPPVLCASAAAEMGRTIRAVQGAIDRLVLPENPPSTAFVGPMHLLEFYAHVLSDADCGFLLDTAHLAIFQRARGHAPLDGFDGFPMERIVEVHVAGGTPKELRGFSWIDDDHSPEPMPETWAIFEHVVRSAPNLKAVVYECEHNQPYEVQANFRRLNEAFPREAG
ncbi:MAG: DUF692 family protein [Alphaproteobacteria bacterium]|nr:DUF692 family protein [Alphaproteobacteria bacterium]